MYLARDQTSAGGVAQELSLANDNFKEGPPVFVLPELLDSLGCPFLLSIVGIWATFTDTRWLVPSFNERELERYGQVRRAAGQKESGIRTHVLIFNGAWSRMNNKLYDVPPWASPKIKMPKFSTE